MTYLYLLEVSFSTVMFFIDIIITIYRYHSFNLAPRPLAGSFQMFFLRFPFYPFSIAQASSRRDHCWIIVYQI